MGISKRLVIMLVSLLAVVTLGSLSAYQLARWTLRSVRPTPAASIASLLIPQSSGPRENTPSSDDTWRPAQVGAAMSDAFNTGKLPQPLDVAAADPDSAALELARKVSLQNEDSTSAFLAAIKAAGFNVRGTDGKAVVGTSHAGQGIAFDDWEIASAAKLYGDGFHISLEDFSDAFTLSVPGFKNVPLAKLIMAGIRSDAESKKPELRFWSRFIVALGKQASPSYDLLSPALDPQKVQLDPLQFAFITRRLAADFAILGAKRAKPAKDKSLRSQSLSCQPQLRNVDFHPGPQPTQLLDSVWHPGGRLEYTAAAFQESSGGNANLPCNLSEGQMQILDGVAYGFGVGFDQLMEILGEPGILTEGATEVTEIYAKAGLIANILLTYGKLVFTALTLHASIEMDAPPLVRSIDPVPGCRRKLKAQIVQKVGNWQILNCLRTALNAAGLDVSLPKDGPLEGAPTMWHIVEGGVNVAEAAATGGSTAIVEFVCNGPRIQDPGTYAGIQGVVPGGIAIGDCVQPKTDEEGRTEVDIEGTGRRNSLQGWASPVMKTAKVQLNFAAKPPNMRQDLIDTLAAGGLLSNPITLLTTVPVEMILRSRWFASPVFTVPVKDWQACGSGWTGTITYTETQHLDDGDQAKMEQISLQAESGPNADALSHGDLSSVYTEGLSHGKFSLSYTSETGRGEGCHWSTSASGGGDIDMVVSPMGLERFTVGIVGTTPDITGEYKVTGQLCPASGKMTVPSNFEPFDAKYDPQTPDELNGTFEKRDPANGTEYHYKYHLSRCSRIANVCRQ